MRSRAAAAAVVADTAVSAAIHTVVTAEVCLETEADSAVQATPAISGTVPDGPAVLRNTMKRMMSLLQHLHPDDLQNLEHRPNRLSHHQRRKRLIYSTLVMMMSFRPRRQYLLPQLLGRSLLLV